MRRRAVTCKVTSKGLKRCQEHKGQRAARRVLRAVACAVAREQSLCDLLSNAADSLGGSQRRCVLLKEDGAARVQRPRRLQVQLPRV